MPIYKDKKNGTCIGILGGDVIRSAVGNKFEMRQGRRMYE